MNNKVHFMKAKRTLEQNRALHKGCELLAERLNAMGLDQRVVLKPSVQINWDAKAVKEQLFKPIMKAMLHKTSTTQLDKIGEIDEIWDILMKHLGEKFHVEYVDFPHDPEKFHG
jgi:hypothetical protein